MRRAAAVREGMVIGAVAASKPRTVVVAAPVAYGQYPPAVYPAGQTEVMVTAGYTDPMTGYPAPMPGYPATTTGYPVTTAGYPPTTAGYPPTTAGYPPPGGVYGNPMMSPMGPTVVEVGRPPMGPGGMAVGAAVAAAAIEERRHFLLINEATCTVLGVEKCCIKPGTFLVLDKRRPDRSFHQIWYLDREGILISKLTDFAPDGKKIDERIHMMPYVGDVRQQWIIEGNRIVNKLVRTECLGLRKHLRLKDDADVIVSPYEGKPWQHWRVEPIII